METEDFASDAVLFARMRAMWQDVDPVPAELVDRMVAAVAVEDLSREYALLTLVSGDLAAVRGETDTATLQFSDGTTSVLVRVTATEDGSRRIDGWVDAAALATGRGFADALTASEIAGAASAPIVLVRGDGGALDPAMKATLNELGATSAMIAGGRGSVSACVEVSLISAGIGVTRYGGANRYETSQLINAAM